MKIPSCIYEPRITLQEIRRPIWRLVQVPIARRSVRPIMDECRQTVEVPRTFKLPRYGVRGNNSCPVALCLAEIRRANPRSRSHGSPVFRKGSAWKGSAGRPATAIQIRDSKFKKQQGGKTC